MTYSQRLPRSKYNEVDKSRLEYAKQRRPKKSATRRMQRRLLRLLGKQIGQWSSLCRQYAPMISLTAEQHKRILAIREVHRQQIYSPRTDKLQHNQLSSSYTTLSANLQKFD